VSGDSRLRESGQNQSAGIEKHQGGLALCLEVRAERGLPLTVETQQVEVLV
jgi:Holliday junction resolvase